MNVSKGFSLENKIIKSSPDVAVSSLKSVTITGCLNGLMLNLNQRQEYVNNSGEIVEFVYTFPLPFEAALLDLRVTLADCELVGTVVSREESEQKYEKAIDEGDAPIMVNQSADGLYTVNIGNVKPGEEVAVTVRYAQLLRFEQGHLSLRLPTVIAPRYGDAYAVGGLAPHETDQVDISAEYPLAFNLEIIGELAKARLTSPTHRILCRAEGDSKIVTIDTGARLDRDVVLNFDDLAGRSFALNGSDEDHEIVLASFCPNLSNPDFPPAPLRLKALVDCSGSMAGDSITGTRKALRNIAKQLSPLDKISYSRFGSDIQHDMNRLTTCDTEARAVLEKLIDATDADMGGTEMQGALMSVFNDIGGLEDRADVLLITDGEIWDTDGVINAARQSGHRIFAIGVSSAPVESLLRMLAEQTQGACELISPGDDFEAAVKRQLNRMRGQKATDVEIDWGVEEPVWQAGIPRYLYDGETIHAFAAFKKPIQQPPILRWRVNGRDHALSANKITVSDNPNLRRLGGRRRMASFAADSSEALELALKYQLVSPQTSLFLVRVREEGDKVAELPRLANIKHMLAAGYGGMGSVMGHIPPPAYSCSDGIAFEKSTAPIMAACCASPLTPRKGNIRIKEVHGSRLSSLKQMFRRKEVDSLDDGIIFPTFITSPREIWTSFTDLAKVSTDFQAIINHIEQVLPNDRWFQAVNDLITNEGLDHSAAWALALFWLAKKLPVLRQNRQSRRLLRRALAAIDDTRRDALLDQIDRCFPYIKAESWV